MKKIKATGICLSILFSSFMLSFILVDMVSADSTYYVSTTGSDTTGDGSFGNPYATLQKALNVSGAGDTIFLRGGNYNTMYYSTTGYRITKTGTREQPFTIASYPGERAVIDGNGYTLDSGMALFLMYYSTSYSNNVTIRDLTFANSTQNGIRAAGGSTGVVKDLSILNCSFANMSYRAILLQTTVVETSGHIENVSVENCTFNDIQTSYSSSEGITFIGVKDFHFCNNTVEYCRKIHLDISGGCIYGDVYNNVFHLNDSYSGDAIYIDPYGHNDDKVSFIDIYDNMIYGERDGASSSGANAIALCGEVSGDSVDNVSIYNNVINISCPDISNPGTILYNGICFKHNYQAVGNKIDNITVKFNTVYIRQGGGYPFFTNILRDNLKNVVVANNIFITNETRLTTFQVWVTQCNITDSNVMMYNNLYNYTNGHTNKGKWISTQNVSEASAIISSPLFVNIETGNFHLNATSPAIDAGNSTYIVSTDYDGIIRPKGNGYDIGAYEYEAEEEPEPPSNDGYQFWNVTISDPDGDTTSGTIVCSDGSSMSWTDEANGTRSLNMTHLEYDTNYTVWLNFTDDVCSVYEVYWFITESGPSLAVDDPYPVDESVEVARPPVNLSAFITGTDIDVYFYFVNMTPTADVWTLVDSWSGISDERVAYTTLSSFGTTYEFLWGNTTYTWSVNISDGVDWLNESFTFTTVAVADGSDARYDVDNDGIVFVGDLSRTWAKRTSQVSYIGLYDVDEDDTVFVGDLSRIWANR